MTSKFLREFSLIQSGGGLETLFEDPSPVSPQNFFNLFIAETALGQFSGEVPRVRVVLQIGNEVWGGKFCC